MIIAIINNSKNHKKVSTTVVYEHYNSWNRDTNRWDFKKKVNLTGKGNDELEDWNTAGKDQRELKILLEGIAVPTSEK